MTDLRFSQFGSIGVASNVAATGLRFSQLGSIAVGSNPAAAGLRVSQFFVIAVTANNKPIQSLGPVINLNCWTPCGVLAWNGS